MRYIPTHCGRLLQAACRRYILTRRLRLESDARNAPVQLADAYSLSGRRLGRAVLWGESGTLGGEHTVLPSYWCRLRRGVSVVPRPDMSTALDIEIKFDTATRAFLKIDIRHGA